MSAKIKHMKWHKNRKKALTVGIANLLQEIMHTLKIFTSDTNFALMHITLTVKITNSPQGNKQHNLKFKHLLIEYKHRRATLK